MSIHYRPHDSVGSHLPVIFPPAAEYHPKKKGETFSQDSGLQKIVAGSPDEITRGRNSMLLISGGGIVGALLLDAGLLAASLAAGTYDELKPLIENKEMLFSMSAIGFAGGVCIGLGYEAIQNIVKGRETRTIVTNQEPNSNIEF